MKSFRAHWEDDTDEPYEAPKPLHLYAVSRNRPVPPRWGRLYVSLIAVASIGAATHLVVHGSLATTAVDAPFGLALFIVLAGWIHLNRVALVRLDEPEAGPGRPQVRIVRPQRRGEHEPQRSDVDDDRVIVPFDFR